MVSGVGQPRAMFYGEDKMIRGSARPFSVQLDGSDNRWKGECISLEFQRAPTLGWSRDG